MRRVKNTDRPVNHNLRNNTPLWQSRDPLFLVIVTIVIGLAGLFLFLYLSVGTGKALADTPWYVPTMHSLTGLAAFSVAFLALGRHSVLRDPPSYWIGVGFSIFGILSICFVLVWPGLLPDGRAIVAVTPNTSAWFAALELISLGSLLLAAGLASRPGEHKQEGNRWLVSVMVWMTITILISILSIAFEQFLPALVGPNGTLTRLLLTWDWLFLFLFGFGAVLSTRRYLQTQDRLFGFVALSQIALSFVILTALIGAKRYDVWYYLSRMVLVGGFLTLLFGLLSEHVQLFRRVLESEARYRQLTEDLPQLIWTSRPDGQFDYLSPQWLAYTGVPQTQQLGSGWLNQVHPDDRQRIAETWQNTVASGGVLDTELCLRRQDGSHRWFKILALPIRDQQGRITQWFGSCTDIQEQKQAEEALQAALRKAKEGSLMLDAIMENIPIGLAVTGDPPNFPLVRVSRMGLEMSQRSTDSLVGLPAGQHQGAWKILLPDGVTSPLPDQMPLYRASRFGEEVRNVEFVMEAQDGRKIPVLVNAAPVRDAQGNIVAAINTWMDISERKRAEEALLWSEQKFEAIYQNVPYAVNLADPADGSYLDVNHAWLELTGTKREEVIGKTGVRLGLILDQERRQEIFRLLQQQGSVRNFEISAQKRTGERLLLAVNVDYVTVNGKKYLLSVMENITERRRVEEQYTTMFNLVSQGFAHYKAVYNGEGNLVDILVEEINPAGAAISGVAREDQIGRTWRQVWPGVDDQLFARYQRANETGETIRFDDHNRMTGRIYDVVIFRTVPGEFVVTFSDVTERKLAEEALAAYARDLERSNRDLQEFAFVASHDLQEPLRKIETFSSLLLEAQENLNEHQRDLLSRMDKSANRMRSMVDGLLQLSRLETHAQPFQPVDLNQAIQDVLTDLEAQVRRTGGTVEVCDLPVIEADPLQMRRLFQNLIDNALKFQPPGGKPQVKVCPAQDTLGLIKILVADNGIGFDEAHATRLFEPFKRLVGKSEYEGSGMGLAICRKIVERHNGEITVRSQPGQGTTFIVTLPIHQDRTTPHTIRRLQHNGGQAHVSDR